MQAVYGLFELLGGIAVFMLGIRFVTENLSLALSGKLKSGLTKITKSKYTSVICGATLTALLQSSVAVNMAVISLVEQSIISFTGACAVIIGTNIGTTITAQLVSLSTFGGLDFAAIGALICFAGFCLSESSQLKRKRAGNIVCGFGLVFTGINLMTCAIENFYGYSFFVNFFLIESPPILLLNGIFITAICQSSSVVTSMLVILFSGGMLPFKFAIYMILGANIGSALSVFIVSLKLNVVAIRTALFNVIFNIFGGLIFFLIMLLTGDRFADFLYVKLSGGSAAVANFHTFFNLVVGVITLPFLNVIVALCVKLIPCISIKGAKGKKNGYKKNCFR